MRIALTAVLILIVAGSGPALAQIVSSNAEGNVGGTFTSDPQGPSAGPVTSALTFAGTFTLGFGGTGLAQGAMRPDGSGAVAADVLIANGQPSNYVEASATWSETITNTTGGPVAYVLDFLITPAALRIEDFAGLPDAVNNAPDVSFLATIRVDGGDVFTVGASMFGGDNSHTLTETGPSLNPTFVPGSAFGYDFDPYVGTVDLGTVPDGVSITVEYEMVARVDTPGYEAGGSAKVGDPFDLDGTPGFSGTIRPDTPVDAASRSWGALKSLYTGR